jgi:hypothetical protein
MRKRTDGKIRDPILAGDQSIGRKLKTKRKQRKGLQMKSPFTNERILGTCPTLAGDAPDIKSKFKIGLVTINQELWLVLASLLRACSTGWWLLPA